MRFPLFLGHVCTILPLSCTFVGFRHIYVYVRVCVTSECVLITTTCTRICYLDLLRTSCEWRNTGFGEPPTESRPIFKKFGLNPKTVCIIAVVFALLFSPGDTFWRCCLELPRRQSETHHAVFAK